MHFSAFLLEEEEDPPLPPFLPMIDSTCTRGTFHKKITSDLRVIPSEFNIAQTPLRDNYTKGMFYCSEE